MSEPIQPALSPDEWAEAAVEGTWFSPSEPLAIETEPDGVTVVRTDYLPKSPEINGADIPPAIALLNAALPDGDPRKITRAMVDAVRVCATEAAGRAINTDAVLVVALAVAAADALASYLPPEP